MLVPLSAGNAVKLVLRLSTGSAYQRILCKTSDTFTGPDDPNALMVVDLCSSDFWVDARDSLVNGVPVFYRAYEWIATNWVDIGGSFGVTPATSYVPDVLDVQEFVRARVQLGITAAVARQQLFPPSGAIEVVTAPFGLSETTTFPTISVHLENTGPDVRGLGDEVEGDLFVSPDTWYATEGWLAQTSLNIVGVSQNADERIQLRKVLRQIIQANLPVFSGVGMSLIEFRQSDSEEFVENNTPLYRTNGSFNAVAPAWIRSPAGIIDEITLNPGVQATPVPDYLGVQDV